MLDNPRDFRKDLNNTGPSQIRATTSLRGCFLLEDLRCLQLSDELQCFLAPVTCLCRHLKARRPINFFFNNETAVLVDNYSGHILIEGDGSRFLDHEQSLGPLKQLADRMSL